MDTKETRALDRYSDALTAWERSGYSLNSPTQREKIAAWDALVALGGRLRPVDADEPSDWRDGPDDARPMRNR